MSDADFLRNASGGTVLGKVFVECHGNYGSRASTKMQAGLPHRRKRGFQNDAVEQKAGVMATATIVKAETPHKALARRLRQAREGAKLTQEQVGEACEVTHRAVGQWERGSGIESVNLFLAAQKINVSLDWLVFGMRGSIEARIAALPDMLREGLMEEVTAAIERAERIWQRRPEMFGEAHVPDADPRLTEWSAKDKIAADRKPKSKAKKKPSSN